MSPGSGRVGHCPLCQGNALWTFLERKNVPVHQNQLMEDESAARRCVRGDLSLSLCRSCGFIFNSAFDLKLLSYADDYDNTQMCSAVFSDYVDRLVRHLVQHYHLSGKKIVEVGCGKGAFLKKLCAVGNNTGIGFDPSYEGPDSIGDGRVRFIRKFYDEEASSVAADFVVCRHVLEHVPNPLRMLASVRKALRDRPDTTLFFEVPCVDWILETGTFWDLFYEHCSYFNSSTFRSAFRRSGFSVETVRKEFGGQYLWLEAKPAGDGMRPNDDRPEADQAVSRIEFYVDREKGMMQYCREQILRWKNAGGCAIWGAGAKGVTLLNTLDEDRTMVDYVIDLNPNKQGHYIPGTGHPICPPEKLKEKPVAGVLVMNPNYLSENREKVDEMGLDLPLVSL